MNSRLKVLPRFNIFYFANFLHFIALNAIWTHFLGSKLRFHPILYSLNMLNTCPDMGATLCMGHKHAISVK